MTHKQVEGILVISEMKSLFRGPTLNSYLGIEIKIKCNEINIFLLISSKKLVFLSAKVFFQREASTGIHNNCILIY